MRSGLSLLGGVILAVGALQAPLAAAEAPRPAVPPPAIIAVTPPDERGERITIHLRDAEVRDLIEAVFKGSGLDYILATDIRCRLSVHLEGVPREKALKLVLAPCGLTYTRQEGVYVIRKADAPEQPAAAAYPPSVVAVPIPAPPAEALTQADLIRLRSLGNSGAAPGLMGGAPPIPGGYGGVGAGVPWPGSGYGLVPNPAAISVPLLPPPDPLAGWPLILRQPAPAVWRAGALLY